MSDMIIIKYQFDLNRLKSNLAVTGWPWGPEAYRDPAPPPREAQSRGTSLNLLPILEDSVKATAPPLVRTVCTGAELETEQTSTPSAGCANFCSHTWKKLTPWLHTQVSRVKITSCYQIVYKCLLNVSNFYKANINRKETSFAKYVQK